MEMTRDYRILEAPSQQCTRPHRLPRLDRYCNIVAATVQPRFESDGMPNLKKSLKGHSLINVPAIQRLVTESLKNVTTADPLGVFQHDNCIRNDAATPKKTILENYNNTHLINKSFYQTTLFTLRANHVWICVWIFIFNIPVSKFICIFK